ncbi:hypothetical protein [Caballeronia choica]|uniref:hypothetical protein n=1 Tax=Caballeronia choica TaxID=326476 RepID=UPI000B3E5FB1|nr:hypothetical protein [Caballeronia choica]
MSACSSAKLRPIRTLSPGRKAARRSPAKLGHNPLDFDDGLDAHYAGKSIKAGWDVARSAGPALQGQLASVLPTRMGLTTITADEPATMPETVLAALPWRAHEWEEVARLVAMMHEHSERFPDEAIKAADRADSMPSRSGDDMRNARAKQAIDRPRGHARGGHTTR